MTTTKALAGDPVRSEVSPKRRERKPSRQRANSMREPAVAVPRALAKALTITPKFMASAMMGPT
jgi:hypothetical protein